MLAVRAQEDPMPFDPEELDLQKAYYRAKLAAQKQTIDVVKKVKEGKGEFVLLDTRDAASHAKERIPGAISVPLERVADAAATLPRDRELVTYCWHAT
jgi:rhodanese-related sulfurtransferase